MEEKELPTYPDSYFEELIEKIRKIRRSGESVSAKLTDYMETTIDYDPVVSSNMLKNCNSIFTHSDYWVRFTNMLLCKAEDWADQCRPISMADVRVVLQSFIRSEEYMKNLYDQPSFKGIYKEIDDEVYYRLPAELSNMKTNFVGTKTDDINWLIFFFSRRNKKYRRVYEMLNELDKKVLKCVKDNLFPANIFIKYKKNGRARFIFSHFEVQLSDYDHNDTIYVVYKYDNVYDDE